MGEMMLKGKAALVTGGATGIGAAIAEALAKNGAKVVINYRKSKLKAEGLKEQLLSLGLESEICQGDISLREDCKKLIDFTVAKYGTIDILVSNSGNGTNKESFLDLTDGDFDNLINTNLKGTFMCCQEAIKKMLEQKNGGSIICISSTAVQQPRGGNGIYGASKAGIEVLANSIAQDFGKDKIRCNIVTPGPTQTDMLRDFFTEEKKEILKNSIPLREIGEPVDVANAVLYLASDMAKYVTGQRITVDGGRTIR